MRPGRERRNPQVSTTALDGEVVIVIENLETGEPLHVGISNN
ncbi:hypothetical protein [Halococcus salsus]|nr:hypothetical protein [Halococcus salsus]